MRRTLSHFERHLMTVREVTWENSLSARPEEAPALPRIHARFQYFEANGADVGPSDGSVTTLTYGA
jgi:hypothetical protein